MHEQFTHKVWNVLFAFLFLTNMMFGAVPAVKAQDPAPITPTITTDKPDYAPGETVTLTGAGWLAEEAVHIVVNDDAGQQWAYESSPDPVADGSGGFTYAFQLPNWFIANYMVTATGLTSGATAATTFTDVAIGTYDQCSNDTGTGYTSGDTGCRWINGNLQSNNSIYMEGDATVQRLWLTDLVPGTSHTVTFQYGTTKGGKHAYDFLTTWNWSENWISVADRCQGIAGCETAGEMGFNIPQDPNVPDSFEPSARQFTIRGGAITAVTSPTVTSGTYSGDSETSITVTFTVDPASGAMCSTKSGTTTCGIAIWFGAHVSAQANWGLGLGAGSISGSPYHVALAMMDGASVGQRDNQMQAGVVAVIPNGTIVIVKDAVPNDAQDFSFNLNNNSTITQNFALDDDADPTLPNSQTFSVPPGTWTASELNLPMAGWDFTKVVCVDPTNNTTVSGAVATIALASNETVTCTYTNTKRGSIIVKKTTTGGDATFAYSTTGGDGFPANFNITTTGGAGSQTYNNIVPGNYSVAETPLPTGWSLVSSSCDSGSPSAFTVAPGGTVTCTFNNTRDTGSLKITKAFNPLTSGFTGAFTVNYDCSDGTAHDGSVELTAGQSTTISGIPTGTTCTVSEPTLPAAPTGWTFGTATISPTQPVTIGSTQVEVTVTNTITRDQGYLKISKAFDPKTSGFTGKFSIVYNCGGGDQTVELAAGADTTVGPFDTGVSCTVSEPNLPPAPTGWTFGAPVVTGSPATITRGDQAAAVTVTVTNSISHDQGYLKISKVFDPLTSGFTGKFSIVYNCGGGDQTVELAAGADTTVGPFDTGTQCTVSEPNLPPAPTGWTFGTPSVSPTQPVTIVKGTSDTPLTVTVTNSISRDTGSLQIKKVFDPLTSGFTGAFTVNYDCSDGAAHDGSVTLTAGETATISGIPTGTTCTVSEPSLPAAPADWTFGAPAISPDQPVTIGSTPVLVTVTNTIAHDQGYLKISKAFDKLDSDFTGTFDIDYACGSSTGTVHLAAGADTTVGPFDTGTSCTVTEPALPTNPTGWTFGAPVISGSPATITKGDAASAVTVTVTNSITRDTGSLQIAKTVSNPDGATLPASFQVNYTCGSLTGQVSVASGSPATVSSIPTGTTCTIEEVAPAPITGYTWGDITYTPANSVVITAKGETYTITVGNSISRDLGSLKIAKTLDNPDGATVPATFTVNYDCGSLTGQMTVATNAPATVTNIPTGSTCTVTEVAPTPIDGFTWGDITYSPASVEITTKGETYTITVGNSIARDRGTLEITKTVSNPDGAALPTSFKVNYDCGTGYTSQVDVVPGTPVTIPGIPTGSTCTLTEVAPDPIPGYTWADPTFTPASVVIDTKGQTFTIAVANSITRDRGALQITKALDNPDGAPVPATFKVNYDCGSGYTGSVDVAPGASVTVPNIPTSSVCTVTEVAPDPIPGYTWGLITYAPASVTINTKGQTFTITVGNSITRDLGSLKLSKTLVGGPANYTGPFTINYDCDGSAHDGSVAVAAGEFQTVSGIPTGTSCTISETLPTEVPPGYAFADPVFSPSATVTISEKGAVVEVTTANKMGQNLTVSKTAVPSFTRTWTWMIDKAADATYERFAGESVTHGYTVDVIPTSSDSLWKVEGVITLTNPNSWEDITAHVADTTDLGGTCAVETGKETVTVPAGQSVTVGYTCTWADKPASYTGANTATVTWDKALYATPAGSAAGIQNFEFSSPTEVDPTITVTDDKYTPVTPWTANRAAAHWTYDQTFTCPIDPAAYAGDGIATVSQVNTATINETGQSDSASVTLNCYAPVVSKTALATYDERHTWSVNKTASPETQNAFAGDSASIHWTVTVGEETVDQNFKVTGQITVANPAPMPMTVTLTDALGGGTAAEITNCTADDDLTNGLTIAAGATATCNYTAEPTGKTDTANTVTATLNNINFSNTQLFTFTANKILPEVTLDDTLNPDWPITISDGDTFGYDTTTTCSTSTSAYTDGKYTQPFSNTATLTATGFSAESTANAAVNCYAPLISKTALGTYDEVHDWTVNKTVSAPAGAFAGDTVPFDWTVTVTQAVSETNFAVHGVITITNPAPMPMVADLSDVLGDNTPVTITASGTCAYAEGKVTVSASSAAACDYAATLNYTDHKLAPTTNTGSVSIGGLTATVTANISWTPNLIRPTASVDDDLNPAFPTTTDKTDTYTYTTPYTCSTNPSEYTNGSYTHTKTNTATVTSGSQTSSSEASATVTCYAPIITKTAAASYGERHEWNVEKTVNPVSQSAFAGDTVNYTWTITVTQETFLENYRVTGIITVINPSAMEMKVTLADLLSDSTAATITAGTDCALVNGELTIPASGTATCPYTATPADKTADKNTATATLNGIAFTAEQSLTWEPVVTRGSVDVIDLGLGISDTITDAKSWTVPQTYDCSTDATRYTQNYSYTDSISNTAEVKSGETTLDSSTSTTSITCYVPEVSKTAAGAYDERHQWAVTKTVSPTAQSAFAGETVSYTWTVDVTQEKFEENFVASGAITVVNHNPEDALTVAISDVLSGDIPVTLTSCSGDNNLSNGLTIAAGGTSVCTYSKSLDLHDVEVAPKINTATVVLNAVSYTASDPIEWTPTVINGSATITDQQIGLSELLTEGQTFSQEDSYTCSTDKSQYNETTHSYPFTENNTATVKNGDTELANANASTTVTCYVPTLSKTAAGAYGERHVWDVTKTVAPVTQTAFAGETANFTWTVNATEQVIEENFIASGQITVTNPNPEDALTITLADVLENNATATITSCTGDTDLTDGLTIAAGGSSTCNYSAALSDINALAGAPTSNTASFTAFGVPYSATAVITWTPTITNDSVQLTDQQGGLNETIRDPFTQNIPDSHTCSTNPSDYTNGAYTHREDNTATLTGDGLNKSAEAHASVVCYAPVVTKTVDTYFTRTWAWSITKGVDATYNLFAGDTVAHGYNVSVTPTSSDSAWGVKGSITVHNPNPDADMTLTSLTDVIGGVNVTVTCASLVVPKGGNLTCTYDTGDQNVPTNPFGASGTNTATAAFAGADWTGSSPYTFTTTPTKEVLPVVTVDDDNLTGENWSADRKAGEWTYTKDFACSTDANQYTNGKYSYSLTNTATITETGQTDTATVDVTCYWPQVSITKTGDALSKIGDDVTYNITVTNNTTADAGLRALSCTISDPLISFSKTVTLASGEKSENKDIKFTIPAGAADPFVNTASVTCKPVAATTPVVGSQTFSVTQSAEYSTNLFQPAVEIVKTGPAYATSGDTVTYTFTITNKSSSDSPSLILDSVTDDKLGNLTTPASCSTLIYNGACTFTATTTLTLADPIKPANVTNTVTANYHPEGFPNKITDSDDHTVVLAPRAQLTDTSFCPLANNQFRLLYHMEAAPNIYRLQASNPGQFYFNAFYFGAPGSTFQMSIQIPYPFVTQEGAGNPIQVHDGTTLTSGGCYSPNPSLSGFTIATQAMDPASPAGNQIITMDDYTTKQIGQTTTVTVSGTVPATGMAYVTIHLDYGLKRTSGWKPSGVSTPNPATGTAYPDMLNQVGFGNGAVTIKGVQAYSFARTVGSDTATTKPASFNELKKFAGFLGIVTNLATGDPVANVKVVILDPNNNTLATVYTDADGYYLYAYKHKAKSATYKVTLPDYNKSVPVTVKANGFAAVDFDLP